MNVKHAFLVCQLAGGERALFNLADTSSIVENKKTGGCLLSQYGEEPWEIKNSFEVVQALILKLNEGDLH